MTRVLSRLLPWSSWMIAGLIISLNIVSVPAFHRLDYWGTLLYQYFPAAALAIVLTPIIVTGGIDLSVGSVAVFASVVTGALWRDLGWPLEWALLGGMLAGLFVGLINGGLVAAGVLPLVVTLATRELFRGLAFSLSGTTPVSRFPPAVLEIWRRPILGVPPPLLVLGALFLVTYLLFHHSWIGRMTFALGDNEQAARFAGVPVRALKIGLYGWCGLAAGCCGVALVLSGKAAKADAERSLDLIAITCVVLGGIRITGGEGHLLGTLLGILTVVTLLNGLTSVAAEWRETLTGAVLVAVAISNEAAGRWVARHKLRE